MPNLLVELGTEELPVDILDVIYGELRPRASERLGQYRLAFKEIRVEATPRRIALFVEGIANRQEDETVQSAGPSVEKAYDAEGRPTPALQGFLKSKQATLKEITVKETPRGKHITLERVHAGKSAASVLPAILNEIFTSLSFPKMMRWESTGARFPRPVRWIVALLDKRVLSFSFGAVRAGDITFGHRFLHPKPVRVQSADWETYRKTLKRCRVFLDLAERKSKIGLELQGRFGQKTFDQDLVHITAQLAEDPYMLQGSFSKDYLELPSEALASCMKKNQKIFALYDARGRLTGQFAAVLNGRRKGLSRIRRDYENVLESRLRDARYFFKADTREPLENKLALLEQVTYLGKLGNMRQKTERIESLAETFAGLIHGEDVKANLKRAARLSKIDLMTHLVYEFPDLQGIAGREYALKDGEKEPVGLAIADQYSPKNLSENYQDLRRTMTPLGALLGLVDRMDHLVGAFGTGLQPTGSQDPYALRRAGGAFVKIVRAFPHAFSLGAFVDASVDLYGGLLSVPAAELKTKLLKFLEDRIIFELQVKAGTREYEILAAVLKAGAQDIAGAYERFEILTQLYHETPDVFIRAAKVVERTANILKGAPVSEGGINPGTLKEASEQKLYQLIEERSGELRDCLKDKNYRKVTERFGEIFYAPLHDFFDQVMVNVEDAQIRANRQALMRRINRLYTEHLADLSVLSRLDQG